MGCRLSRLDPQKEEMVPKWPPILSRKLEEIRRRKAEVTLSKKQLLKDGSEDDSASGHHKCCVTSPEPDDDSIGSAMVAPEPTEPEEMFSDGRKQDNKNAEDENNNKEEDDGIRSVNVAPKQIEPEDDEKEKVAEDVTGTTEKLAMEEKEAELEVEEYGRFTGLDGPLTCPASPSFRCYIIDSLEDDKDDHGGKDDYMNKGSLSDTDVDAAEIVESQTSTKESAVVIKKKRRRGMKLKRVITRGKPVKNLLSVKSCYYPSCVDRQLSPRLIAAKSATY